MSRKNGRLALLPVLFAVAPVLARADPLPTIATYELSKARHEAGAVARDPRGFWIGEIVARIEDRKTPSRHAIKQPMTVELSFIVARDGRLMSKAVTHSSGDPAIDREAIAVLDRAAPFPPMPAAVPEAQLAFTVPLRFR